MTADAVTRAGQTIPRLEKSWLRDVPELSNAQIATLGDSAALLSTLLRCLGCETMVVSAFGLREGLLYGQLDPRQRAEDPLVVAAREEGRRLGRFVERSEEHTSELQSLMRISYAVFCLT